MLSTSYVCWALPVCRALRGEAGVCLRSYSLGSTEDRHRPEIAAWERNIDRVRWQALGAEGGKRTSVRSGSQEHRECGAVTQFTSSKLSCDLAGAGQGGGVLHPISPSYLRLHGKVSLMQAGE